MVLLAGVALASEPRFVVPDGWTDLSPGKSLDGLDEDDKARAQAAAKAHYLLYAVDKQTDDDFPDNVNAYRQPSRTWSDEASIESLKAEMEEKAGGALEIKNSEVRKIAGVDAVRFEATLNPGNGIARQLYYVMPLGDDSAVLVFSTGKETWEAMKPVFDATAAKTTGLAPPTPSRWGTIILVSLLGGVLGGGLLGGLAWLLKRRRAEE